MRASTFLLGASLQALHAAALPVVASDSPITATSLAATSSPTAVPYDWSAGYNSEFTIHQSCNATERREIALGLEGAVTLARHAKDHSKTPIPLDLEKNHLFGSHLTKHSPRARQQLKDLPKVLWSRPHRPSHRLVRQDRHRQQSRRNLPLRRPRQELRYARWFVHPSFFSPLLPPTDKFQAGTVTTAAPTQPKRRSSVSSRTSPASPSLPCAPAASPLPVERSTSTGPPT
jgi:hypothetical protein